MEIQTAPPAPITPETLPAPVPVQIACAPIPPSMPSTLAAQGQTTCPPRDYAPTPIMPSYSPSRFTPPIAQAAVFDSAQQGTDNAAMYQATPTCVPPDAEIEAKLTAAIAKLWGLQKDSNAKVQSTREELKVLRLKLAKSLHDMKAILVRTGRGGGWAAYLRSQQLPLATADRYVAKHEATLAPSEEKLLSEEHKDATVDEVRQLAQKLLPRLSRVLISQELIFEFIHELLWSMDVAEVTDTLEGMEIFQTAKTDQSDGPGLGV